MSTKNNIIKPIGARVLTESVVANVATESGIIIPDTAKETPTEAIIIALGTGELNSKGEKIPFEFAVGDHVFVSKYGGTEIVVDKKTYKVYNASDILAKVERE